MVSGVPSKLKATLTPESFRSGQADLLKQASFAAKALASPCHRRLPLPPLLPVTLRSHSLLSAGS